jgi:hypothetical protein
MTDAIADRRFAAVNDEPDIQGIGKIVVGYDKRPEGRA